MRPDNSARREEHSGQHEEGSREPPGEVQDEELPSRETRAAGPVEHSWKKIRKMLLRPDGPGGDDHDEEEQISPTEEETKTQAGFAEKDREQTNACEIEKAFQTLARQAKPAQSQTPANQARRNRRR